MTMAQGSTCSRSFAETFTLIYAILNCIITSFGSFLLLLGFCIFFMYNRRKQDSYLAAEILMCWSFVVVAFGFSVILANGMMKRNAVHVKIYFVYIVAVVFLLFSSVVAASLIRAGSNQDYLELVMTIIAAVAFIHLFILVMIRHTYKKFERESAAAPHLDLITQKHLEANK